MRDHQTTKPGYLNDNGQLNIRPLGIPGTDHCQSLYQLACTACGLNYAANGSDIHLRLCPSCGGGAPSTADWDSLTTFYARESADNWPFLYDRDASMISLQRIVEGKSSVLYVTHDAEGGYQFLDNEDIQDSDAAVVGLEQMIRIDKSLTCIALLAPGWGAVRQTLESAWQVFPLSEDEDEE